MWHHHISCWQLSYIFVIFLLSLSTHINTSDHLIWRIVLNYEEIIAIASPKYNFLVAVFMLWLLFFLFVFIPFSSQHFLPFFIASQRRDPIVTVFTCRKICCPITGVRDIPFIIILLYLNCRLINDISRTQYTQMSF